MDGKVLSTKSPTAMTLLLKPARFRQDVKGRMYCACPVDVTVFTWGMAQAKTLKLNGKSFYSGRRWQKARLGILRKICALDLPLLRQPQHYHRRLSPLQPPPDAGRVHLRTLMPTVALAKVAHYALSANLAIKRVCKTAMYAVPGNMQLKRAPQRASYAQSVGTTLIPVVLTRGYMIVWKRTAIHARWESQTSNEPIVTSAMPAQKFAMADVKIVKPGNMLMLSTS
mmetsp:Transcript_71710/g.202801  ORF Transcript_71710/g.202801 Transcript_71710/m.202801 type:complete len:226 (+) Transcript_71710:658-1335(+)